MPNRVLALLLAVLIVGAGTAAFIAAMEHQHATMAIFLAVVFCGVVAALIIDLTDALSAWLVRRGKGAGDG